VLRRVLAEVGFVVPGAPCDGEVSVAPRVSFLVRDRHEASTYFLARGIELGEWFDGPLSPPPTSPRFGYVPGRYPKADSVARQVVNVPCHSGLTDDDVEHVCSVVRSFARESMQRPVRACDGASAGGSPRPSGRGGAGASPRARA
jgi:dTDP-4-amino-4,6-dideoxygalactose transaminase